MSDLTTDSNTTENPAIVAASESAPAEPEESAAPPAEPAEIASAEEPADKPPEVKAAEEPAQEAPEVKAAEEPAEEAPEVKAAEEPAEETPEAKAAEEGATGLAAAAGPITVDAKVQPGEAMALLEKAQKDKTPVNGQIIGWNKGGYHVALGKIAAFCPVSQIEIGKPRGPKRYLDKTFPFLVIEIQKGGRRIVVSRSAALIAEKEARATLVRELLKPGSVLEGKVSSLTDFGAFVDIGGGIEGLVHVSEISRRRVDHPKEMLRKGQEVKVAVLKIEKNGERISLSMKRLEADPWAGVAKRFPGGSEFTGKIMRKADFGLFVEVEPGLEGLVHTSRLPLGITVDDESLAIGQKVSGWVHDVEAKRRRLSLSLRKMATGNPWREITSRFPVGEVVKGKVEKLTPFGVFIELEPGLTGLLPFSGLSTRDGNPRRKYHPGSEVSIRVLSIDRGKRRISLGTETSQAEGSVQDFKEYLKTESGSGDQSSGLGSLAAAFAKAKEQA